MQSPTEAARPSRSPPLHHQRCTMDTMSSHSMRVHVTRASHAAGAVRPCSRNYSHLHHLNSVSTSALLTAAIRRQQQIACLSPGHSHSGGAPSEGADLPQYQQQSNLQWRVWASPAARSQGAYESLLEQEAQRGVELHFMPDDVTTCAQPGDSIMDAAYAAGVIISSGCNSGSCGMCEVCWTVTRVCAAKDIWSHHGRHNLPCGHLMGSVRLQ